MPSVRAVFVGPAATPAVAWPAVGAVPEAGACLTVAFLTVALLAPALLAPARRKFRAGDDRAPGGGSGISQAKAAGDTAAGSAPDGAAPDAAVLDAGVPDAAVLDAGVPDAAVLDAEVPAAAAFEPSGWTIGRPDRGLGDAGRRVTRGDRPVWRAVGSVAVRWRGGGGYRPGGCPVQRSLGRHDIRRARLLAGVTVQGIVAGPCGHCCRRGSARALGPVRSPFQAVLPLIQTLMRLSPEETPI